METLQEMGVSVEEGHDLQVEDRLSHLWGLADYLEVRVQTQSLGRSRGGAVAVLVVVEEEEERRGNYYGPCYFIKD